MGKAKIEPVKMKLNKSAIIREAIKDAKWDGDNQGLSKFLEEKYPGETFSPNAISGIRTTTKEKAEEKPAATGFYSSTKKAEPKKGDFFDDVKSNGTPLLDQLKQLKNLIGANGIKKLVDGL
jgi:hypothetical protein